MKRHFKVIVFVISPLHGSCRIGEGLQIYPCNYPSAPKSTFATRFPCILEFSVDNSLYVKKDEQEQLKIDLHDTELQIDRSNSLMRLLSAITNHHFFKQDEVLNAGVWGIWKDAPENTDEEFRSIWVDELYMWPEIAEDLWPERNFIAPSYSMSPLAAPYAPVVPTSTNDGYHYYFDGTHPQYPDQVVFPDCASAVFNAYETLSPDTKKIIDAVTQLIDNGLALIGRMKSLSFLSFVSAIEALVALNNSDVPETCDKCGQAKHRVTKKFVDFLSTYADNSKKSRKIFSEIYSYRSKIAHAGALLLGDAHEHWEQKEIREKQFHMHKMAAQLARVSLVNWLLSQQP